MITNDEAWAAQLEKMIHDGWCSCKNCEALRHAVNAMRAQSGETEESAKMDVHDKEDIEFLDRIAVEGYVLTRTDVQTLRAIRAEILLRYMA